MFSRGIEKQPVMQWVKIITLRLYKKTSYFEIWTSTHSHTSWSYWLLITIQLKEGTFLFLGG